MGKSFLEKNLTSLVGEFGTASQLCLRGYVASLTLKNYPGVDVFAYNPKNEKSATIQVKASTDGWFNPGKVNKKSVYVYVQVKDDKTLDYYIIPGSKVQWEVDQRLKVYLDSHPNSKKEQPTWVSGEDDFPDCKDKWENLGIE